MIWKLTVELSVQDGPLKKSLCKSKWPGMNDLKIDYIIDKVTLITGHDNVER